MTSNIKTFEDAMAYTGRDLSAIQAFQALPEQDRVYHEACYKRAVVIEALNKEANGGENWTPNWEDQNEYKYYSWVWLKSKPEGKGFVVDGADFSYSLTGTFVGSRLCLKSSELVYYFNDQFKDLLQVVMVE